MNNKVKQHRSNVGAGYNKYWHSAGKQALLIKELDFISRHLTLSKPNNALDIGVGTGRILKNYL